MDKTVEWRAVNIPGLIREEETKTDVFLSSSFHGEIGYVGITDRGRRNSGKIGASSFQQNLFPISYSNSPMFASATATVSANTLSEIVKDGESIPPLSVLLRHPVSLLGVIPKDLSLFCAGAMAGAVAKSVTAPLDRIKLLMQVRNI